MKKIAFAGPSITSREVEYVKKAVKNGWYQTFDKDIAKLEKTIAKYVGVKYALAGFCATHSMHLACLVCGFKKGDEVIVTDFSWVATAHVIAYTGATPVFVDIDPNTWCISPEAIEKAITKKTKGIMIVHSFGIPCDMDAIMKIAKKHNLKVIEDAAPALGSLYKGRPVGGIGDVGCISFHGAKIAVGGEGGMFLTNNKEYYEKAILLSNMGRTDSRATFWSDHMGYEYQMANVTAALITAQVERIEELVANKRRIWKRYYKNLKDVEELKLLKENNGDRTNTTVIKEVRYEDIAKMSKERLIEILTQLKSRSTVQYASQDSLRGDKYVHPTQKPIAILTPFIKNSSTPEEIVLDLFSGSGSTMVAAHQLDRVTYLMEYDPKFCDVIRKRYAHLIKADEKWQEVTPIWQQSKS